MKHYWLIILFGIGLVSFTGCYTQLATSTDDSEEYIEPIVYIDTEPVCTLWVSVDDPVLIPPATTNPPRPPRPPFISPDDNYNEPKYKTRNPQTERNSNGGNKELIRDTGGRNNVEERGKGRR